MKSTIPYTRLPNTHAAPKTGPFPVRLPIARKMKNPIIPEMSVSHATTLNMSASTRRTLNLSFTVGTSFPYYLRRTAFRVNVFSPSSNL